MPASPRLATLLAVLLGALGAAALTVTGLRAAGIDGYHYWAGSRLAAGAGPGFYDPAAAPDLLDREPAPRSDVERLARAYWHERSNIPSAEGSPFISTPFYWATMRGLLAGEFEPALRRTQLLSVASFVVALLLLGRVAGASALAGGALVAFVGVAFLPATFDLATANVNAELLLLGALWLALDDVRGRGPALAGDFLLGLSVAFKPVWIMVLPLVASEHWLRGERRRAVARSAAAALGAGLGIAVGAFYMGGMGAWSAWAAALARARYVGGNISPLRLLGALDLGLVAALIALGAGIAAVAWAVRRPSADERTDLRPRLLALGGLLFLLSSTLVRIHYLVLALPALTLAAAGWRRRPWRESSLLLAAALAVAYVPRRLDLLGGAASAAVAMSGVALLAAWLAWGLARRRDPRNGAAPEAGLHAGDRT